MDSPVFGRSNKCCFYEKRPTMIDLKLFNLESLPFDACTKLTGEYRSYCKSFEPTDMVTDLRSGKAHAVIYWYLSYIDRMFKLAAEKKEPYSFLDKFNDSNSHYFKDVFVSSCAKLDKIYFSRIKTNRLSEMVPKI